MKGGRRSDDDNTIGESPIAHDSDDLPLGPE
jgi:hypothetical protein